MDLCKNHIRRIGVLQKKFRQKKLFENLINIKNLLLTLDEYKNPPKYINLFDQDKQKSDRFDQLQKILMDKNNIMIIDNFLKQFYKYNNSDSNVAPKINARKFLIAWMLVGFPEYVLDTKIPASYDKNTYPYDIYDISLEFIKNIYLVLVKLNMKTRPSNEDIRKFNKSFNIYSNCINYFLIRDKHEHLNKLLTEYVEMSYTIDSINSSSKYSDVEKTKSIELIKQTKTKVAKQIIRINSKTNLSELENFAKLNINLHTQIRSTYIRAFRDILLNDISEAKFSYLKNIIQDINKSLSKVGAKKIDSEFDDKIDPDLIIQMLANGLINIQSVQAYGDYLFGIITKLTSVAAIDLINKKWSDIKTTIFDQKTLLTDMIMLVLEEINNLYTELSEFIAYADNFKSVN
jgi:hypothetical protein